MAIVLYKPGNMAKVRGIQCQFQIFNSSSYKHLLDAGWFLTPEECYPKEVKAPKEEAPKEAPKEVLKKKVPKKKVLKKKTPKEEVPKEKAPTSEFDINSLYNTEPEDAE